MIGSNWFLLRFYITYKVKDKKIVVDPDEAEYVRMIYHAYSKGTSAKDIVADLTKKGITHNRKPFSNNQIYSMLRNKKYIGIAELSDGTYTDMYPPIVPRLLFDEVQAIVAKNKIGSKSVTVDYLLRGICYCGYCGNKIQAETGTSCTGEVRRYYKCFGRKHDHCCNKSIVRKEDLEQIVIDTTIKLLSSTENTKAIADLIMQAHKKRQFSLSTLHILQAEQADTQKAIDNIMKAIEQGIITPTTKRRMDELEEHLKELNDKIIVEQYKEQQQITKDKIYEFLIHALKYKPSLMIRTLVKKVVLYDDKIEIHYKYTTDRLPDYPENTDNRDFLYLDSSIFTSSRTPSRSNPDRIDRFGFIVIYKSHTVFLDFTRIIVYNKFEHCSTAVDMESKETIIQATIALIEEKGEQIDTITVREICKKADVGLGLINYYFENKDKLIDLCVEKIINGIVDKFAEIREQTKDLTPFEKLDRLGNMTLTFLFEHYAVAKISIMTDMRAPKENDNTHRTYLAFLPLVAACRPDWDSDRIKRATNCLITTMQQAFLRHEMIYLTQGANLQNADERKAYHARMLKDILGAEQ